MAVKAPVRAAKRRASTTTKKAPVKKTVSAKTPIKPGGMKAGLVANSSGSLISPETWRQDQERLQAASEDAEQALQLDNADTQDELDYTNRRNALLQEAAKARLQLDRNRFGMRQQAEQEKSNLDTNLSYRGASRGSAGIRQRANLRRAIGETENQFISEDADITTGLTAAQGGLLSQLNTNKSGRAAMRKLLAERAAQRGVYSPGSKPIPQTETKKTPIKRPVPKPPAVKKPVVKKPGNIKKAAARRTKPTVKGGSLR